MRPGGSRRRPTGLSPGEACDIRFEGDRPTRSPRRARRLADRPIDVNVVPAAHRRKRLLVADMDSTMIQQECIDELAAEIGIARRGRRDHRARHARRDRLRAGAARARRAACKGLVDRCREARCSPSASPSCRARTRWSRRCAPRRPYGAGLRRLHRLRRADRASGSASTSTAPTFCCSRADAFTGLVAEPILGQRGQGRGAARADSAARPQSGGDAGGRRRRQRFGMIRRAGLGVAYRAKPALRSRSGRRRSTTAT